MRLSECYLNNKVIFIDFWHKLIFIKFVVIKFSVGSEKE